MNVDSIQNGVVIDHIGAGLGMYIYNLLGLDKLSGPVAVIQNAVSKKYGKKDIIKIDGEYDVNLDILGYADPSATVNIIKDGRVLKKLALDLPEKLTNVIFCKNPRCISQTEQELPHIFKLSSRETKTYRCIYCETKAVNVKR